MSKKLILLDAYALIYRAHFAFIKNPRINSKGLNTSAIFGFCNSLLEVINKFDPSHIGVVFDPPGGSDREGVFADYKANRQEMPEDIRKAIAVAGHDNGTFLATDEAYNNLHGCCKYPRKEIVENN